MPHLSNRRLLSNLIFLSLLAGATACGTGPLAAQGAREGVGSAGESAESTLTLPDLVAPALGGRPLRVVATTSIIGDIVSRVGGDAIDLTTLMQPGEDPHSYEPAAQDLAAAAGADVIFVNGWDLEEALVDNLQAIGEGAPLVPVSAGIVPLDRSGGGDDFEDDHAADHAVDPHVWLSVPNVEQWVDNIRETLGSLDPDNRALYDENAREVLSELEDLKAYAAETLAPIPPGKRFLVTNHDSLAYFASDYGFTVLGTVIPGLSTLAEPSASGLSDLVQTMEAHGVCTIFAETTMRDDLARTAAAELDGCPEVRLITLYTGALGPPGSGADTYVSMVRATVDAVVEGLAGE